MKIAKDLDYKYFNTTFELDSETFKEVIDDPLKSFELGYYSKSKFNINDEYFKYDSWTEDLQTVSTEELEEGLDYHEIDILLEALNHKYLKQDALYYIEDYNIDDDNINEKIKEINKENSEEKVL